MALIKQWVNLDPAEDKLRDVPGEGKIPKNRCGPVVTLRATISPKKKNKRVFWGVELGPDNVEKKAEYANILTGWHKRKTKGGFGAKGFYERLAPTNKKGESICEFRLSDCGGDQFTIKAYIKQPNGKIKKQLKTETYVVWRQLYYQLTRMGPSRGKTALPAIPDINWGGVATEYGDAREPHNVRWTKVPPEKLITRHRSLYNDAMTQKTGVEGYSRKYEPLVLKVSLVDLMAERETKKHKLKVSKPKQTYEYTFNRILFDMNSRDDRDDWFVGAVAHLDNAARDPVNIKREHFKKVGPASIQVTIPRFPLCSGDVKAIVWVGVRTFTGWGLGLSWYNGIWAIDGCTDGGRPPAIAHASAAEKVATMVHEFGHAIGMVPAASPKHYIKHDHVGNHCWNGAADPSTLATADTPFPQPTGAICAMFGDNSSNTEKFCDICSPFVRSRVPRSDGKFKKGAMLPRTW